MRPARRIVRPRTLRGGALLQSLLFSGISGILLAGAGTVCVSNRILAEAERSFSKAVYVAESGLYAELQFINAGPPTSAAAHQSGEGEALDVDEDGERYVVAVKDAEGEALWAPPRDLLIESLGIVQGTTRQVLARVRGRSVFADYAVFGIGSLTFNGTGSETNGDIGTNGTLLASSSGSSVTTAKVVFHGCNPTVAGPNVYTEPSPYWWPTVEAIASNQIPGGLSALRSQNSNSAIRRFNDNRYIDPSFELALSEVAGLSSSDWSLTDQAFTDHPSVVTDENGRDKPKTEGGKRHSSSTDGIFEKYVLIFPAGDYYFEELNVTSGQTAMLIDNRFGPVRIWVGGSGVDIDRLQSTIIFTAPNRTDRFRLYYAKRAELRIAGNTDFPGLEVPGIIYAVNQTGDAQVDISGNTYITGSIIANTVRISGNSFVDFPPGGPVADGDLVRRYDRIVWWRETTAGLN